MGNCGVALAINVAGETRLRYAWGEWLGPIPWSHFATLTFAREPTIEGALRQYRRWIRRLEQRAQRKVYSFRVAERSGGGILHYHALILGTDALSAPAIQLAWSAGRAQVSPYDASRGAAYYVSKDVATSPDYDVDLPRPDGR